MKENEIEQEENEFGQEENILDILLDTDDSKPIILTDAEGKDIAFIQIATIPLDEKVYALLAPKNKMEGVEEDEAFVFYADEDKNELVPVTDEETQRKVFKEYYLMCKEEGIEVPDELLA